MNGQISQTPQVYDVDKLKQRLTKVKTRLGTKRHRRRNGWGSQTSLDVRSCKRRAWFNSTHMLLFTINSTYWYCVKYIKSIAIVDLFCSTRMCSDTSKVQWKIWHEPCWKFTAESNSKRVFFNWPTFLKVMNEYRVLRFLWQTV